MQEHRKRKRQDATAIMDALLAALERLNSATTGEPK
jgi:hypothetical protein